MDERVPGKGDLRTGDRRQKTDPNYPDDRRKGERRTARAPVDFSILK